MLFKNCGNNSTRDADVSSSGGKRMSYCFCIQLSVRSPIHGLCGCPECSRGCVPERPIDRQSERRRFSSRRVSSRSLDENSWTHYMYVAVTSHTPVARPSSFREMAKNAREKPESCGRCSSPASSSRTTLPPIQRSRRPSERAASTPRSTCEVRDTSLASSLRTR